MRTSNLAILVIEYGSSRLVMDVSSMDNIECWPCISIMGIIESCVALSIIKASVPIVSTLDTYPFKERIHCSS